MFSVQTTVGTWTGFKKQTCYNIPSELWLTSQERCSLHNSPKVNQSTANLADKTRKNLELILYISNLVHNTIVYSIVCRKFKPSSIDNQSYSLDYIVTYIPLFLTFFLFHFSQCWPNETWDKNRNQSMKENCYLMLRKCNKFLLT